MRPALWQPPVECSPAEQKIVARIRRAKLFVFLRQYRHEIFDEAFQAELAQGYAASSKGQPPVPPAQLALATLSTGRASSGISPTPNAPRAASRNSVSRCGERSASRPPSQ